MGGRSRKPNLPDRWDWLKELSDNRLDNYGKMSAAKYRENYSDRSKSALHNEAAAEFERRHGSKPPWHYNPHAESTSEGGVKYRTVHTGQKIKLGDQMQHFGADWSPVSPELIGTKVEKTYYPIRRVSLKKSSK